MSEAKKQTILAVDDTLANIDVVKGVLAQDYLVQAALSGKMALKIIEKQKPDLILLDIMMPEMAGHQACMTEGCGLVVCSQPVGGPWRGALALLSRLPVR